MMTQKYPVGKGSAHRCRLPGRPAAPLALTSAARSCDAARLEWRLAVELRSHPLTQLRYLRAYQRALHRYMARFHVEATAALGGTGR